VQGYAAPPDWGTVLADWNPPGNSGSQSNGTIVQTLNGSNQPFPKGQVFAQWLGNVHALGVLGAPPSELPITPPMFNALVGPGNGPSQPWVVDDATKNTMYFSFDTPIGGVAAADGGPPSYCGRAVYSDMHVSGNVPDPVNSGGPAACDQRALSPQEKALEFMLFDLSSCVIPDTEPPPDAGVPVNQ
jgi:hypothetical protein